MSDDTLIVVGGGLAGLVAAVTAAEAGTPVRLREGHARLGGRARSTAPPFVVNDGPHVLYADGALWRWLVQRGLARPFRRLPLRLTGSIRVRSDGRLRAVPPAGLLGLLAHRRRSAPVDQDFRSWVTAGSGESAADAASAFMAVVTYTGDPGALSAQFVWERLLRVTDPTGGPRYLVGGWQALVDRLERHARELGVVVETDSPVTELPDGPVVVATGLPAARRLLERPLPSPATSGSTVLLDAAVQPLRGDVFLLSDLDQPGWVEAYSRVDRTLAPDGTVLLQAHRPVQARESRQQAAAALAELVEAGLPDWRKRTAWQRTGTAHHRTGALDLPGHTWHDRPAVDQGNGVFLAGDDVAAPGLLSEVSFTSAVTAATGATRLLQPACSHRTAPRRLRRTLDGRSSGAGLS